MQQRARLRPFEPTEGLALPAPPARNAMAVEHLPDRAAAEADQPGQPRRAVAGPLTGGNDLALTLSRQRPRTRPGPRRPSPQAGARRPLSCARRPPPVPPPVRRRRRHAERGRGRPQRIAPFHQLNQLEPPRQSELASTVFHVRPLL